MTMYIKCCWILINYDTFVNRSVFNDPQIQTREKFEGGELMGIGGCYQSSISSASTACSHASSLASCLLPQFTAWPLRMSSMKSLHPHFGLESVCPSHSYSSVFCRWARLPFDLLPWQYLLIAWVLASICGLMN